MKTRIIYIISFLILCSSCTVEHGQQFGYDGINGNSGCYTVRVRIPENWKIVDAQLKPKKLTLEFDRGRGIEKQSFPIAYYLLDADNSVQFRGVNRLNGLTLLYFTKEEDPQSVFNPPLGTSKITISLKEREIFAIFRTSNWLVIHYTIKKTDIGNLILHDLRKRYAKNPNNKGSKISFKTIDGKLHYNLVFNNKEKRSFPIDKYYGQHEIYGSSRESSSVSDNELRWTWHYKITSNQKMDR